MRTNEHAALSGRLRGIAVFFLILAAVASGCLAFLARHRSLPDGKVELHFLDVGQGDAAFIVTPEGCVLIDAGSQDTEQQLYFSVNSYGNRLSCLMITHPHADHMGGAAYIMEKMNVDTVILPRASSSDSAYVRFLEAVSESGASVLFWEPGLCFSLGGARFSVLAPLDTYENENDASAVIRMDYGKISALFTGDAETASEADQLLRYGAEKGAALDADILKVAHHGSNTSTTLSYLHAVTPRFAVISCGRDNAYGHPSSAVLDRLESTGAAIFRTDRDGTVTLVTDGSSIVPAEK